MYRRLAIFLIPAVMLLGTLATAVFMETVDAKTLQAADTSVRTVLDGVYTAEQAARGKAQFDNRCSGCHGENLGGGDAPPLNNQRFLDDWREDSLNSLFSFIKTEMPPNASDRLSDEAYVDVLAYILQANTFPADATPLTADLLEGTRLVGKDGPRPVPNNALVMVVGCLTQGSANAWTLTSATEPVRNRKGDETTDEELKASQAKPLGTETFQLRNLNLVIPAFNPDPHKGHKIQVKGVLFRQSTGARINVTSVGAAASSCAQ